MKFTGLLVKESLDNLDALDLVKITATETWDANNASPIQPKIWTAIRFEGEDESLNNFLEALSNSLKPKAWYITIKQKNTEYVVFPKKIFKYKFGDTGSKTKAQNFARSIEVPESQLDW